MSWCRFVLGCNRLHKKFLNKLSHESCNHSSWILFNLSIIFNRIKILINCESYRILDRYFCNILKVQLKWFKLYQSKESRDHSIFTVFQDSACKYTDQNFCINFLKYAVVESWLSEFLQLFKIYKLFTQH